MNYDELLARKAQLSDSGGFAPLIVPDHLFDFQRSLTEFAVRRGRAGIFADCGMGKTAIELAWAENVYRHSGRPVLVLTPLAVGQQIRAEAERFGHDADISRDGSPRAPITITNYEQLPKFDPAKFAGVVCDESSILKNFDGVTKAQVTEFMRLIQYRLLATATAAPNDYTEIGTSSEALGDLGYMDMLARFFVNDDRSSSSRGRSFGGKQVQWRLKGHAMTPFWRWVASWARAVRRPSDLGFDDGGFVLPPLNEQVHLVTPIRAKDGALFDLPAVGIAEEREEARRTLNERCDMAANLLAEVDSGVAWCQLNEESATLTRMIPGAVEIRGSESVEAKEEKLAAFSRGEIRVLVTKASIAGHGLNWQHAHTMTYFPSHSYEQMYQAIRRMWRFGQVHQVDVHLITTPGGERVLDNLLRKSEQADVMFTQLVAEMRNATSSSRAQFDKEMEVPSWLQ